MSDGIQNGEFLLEVLKFISFHIKEHFNSDRNLRAVVIHWVEVTLVIVSSGENISTHLPNSSKRSSAKLIAIFKELRLDKRKLLARITSL